MGGDGVYDPSRHESSFLQRFLVDQNIKITGETDTSDNAARSVGGCSATYSTTVEPLVQRVKSAQRMSEELKQAWHEMCDTEGGGIRDPSRHDAAFLLRFLEMASAQTFGNAMCIVQTSAMESNLTPV